MYLIIGLGNPGTKYENTRHNAGFMVLDELAKENWQSSKKCKGLTQKIELEGKEILLLKPQTYMNLSGEAVRSCMDFYNIDPEKIWVIYDDIDLELGVVRVRKEGSSGGHKGVESLIRNLSTPAFARFRIGVKTEQKNVIPTEDFVLQNFTDEEKKIIQNSIEKTIELIKKSIREGIESTSTN